VTAESRPTFDEAVGRLQQFLVSQGVRRREIRWVFRDDIALQGRALVIRRCERANVAAEKYAAGREAPGVVLSAEGIDEDAVYCTVFVPSSADDAEYRMIRGVKLSVAVPLWSVKIVDDADWLVATCSQTPSQRDLVDDRFQRSATRDQ
jgi:hypothetical protein